MSLIVITGGARSGKSRGAERLAASRGRPVVVAVGAREDDEEMTRRISEHRSHRPEGFRVLEADGGTGWLAGVDQGALLLVECVGTLVGRIVMEEAVADGPLASAEVEERVRSRVSGLLDSLCDRSGDTILVTNEVGSGVVPASASGRLFRDVMGSANRELVERADGAWMAVAGRFVDLRAAGPSPDWPEVGE